MSSFGADRDGTMSPFRHCFAVRWSKKLSMETASSLRKPRVMVAEAEILVAIHIAGLLEDIGCEPVGPAMSLTTALPIALHEQLDAALLDDDLGDQSAKSIAAVLERRGIPFAFLTDYDSHHLPAAHRARPCVDKPFTDSELATAVESLISTK
jgi:hypothetical protein